MLEITEKLIDDVSKKFVQDYIDDKKIEKYFNNMFKDVKYYYREKSVEVFIEEDDLECYDSFFKYDFLLKLVDNILEEEYDIEIDGEKNSWIIDRLLERNIQIYGKSEMIQ